MLEALRNYLTTTGGKVVCGVGLVIAAVLVFFSACSNLGDSDAMAVANTITLTDAELNKPFQYTVSPGDKYPVKSPLSGKEDGYPGELCYWTRDGKPKTDPTYVVLKTMMGKTVATFCPDCGRLVVERNPPPEAVRHPPVSEAEYRVQGSASVQ